MRRRLAGCLALVLALLVLPARAQQASAPVDPEAADAAAALATLSAEQDARYRVLIHELRCLVCQNQTIADSNADLANDLRRQVREHILAGATDDDIRRYVTDRYGEYVLYKPRMSARTLLLWGGPFLVLLLALGIALRTLLRRRPAADSAAPAADTAALRRLLDEER